LADIDLDSGCGAILADGALLSIEEEKRKANDIAQKDLTTPWKRFLDWLL